MANTGKPKDFLASIAFAEGEFEELQEQFESSVGRLAETLVEPIGRSLRAQLTGDVAASYVASARANLDRLLAKPADAGVRELASSEVARRLRLELSRAPVFDEQDVAQEVESCSREVAQLVLARWMERLADAHPSEAGIRLNANLLPGRTSVEETLAGIDLAAHGVDKLVVVNGLRTYWDELVTSSVNDRVPITLSRHLLIVPEASKPDQPFLLFGSRAAAEKEIARPARKARETEQPESDFLRIVEMIRKIMGPGPGTLDPGLASAVYRASLMDKRSNGLGCLRNLNMADVIVAEIDTPERELADSVETGVDLVVAGLPGGVNAVRDLLWSETYAIPRHLQAYSTKRALPFEAVTEAFALAVGIGIRYQTMRHFGAAESPGAPGFTLYKRLAATYGVSEEKTAKLMCASFVGTAFATPGSAFP